MSFSLYWKHDIVDDDEAAAKQNKHNDGKFSACIWRLMIASHLGHWHWLSENWLSSLLPFSRTLPFCSSVMSQTGLSPSNSSIPLSAAENYQLKWNSHVTNLNASISSLLKNDKYADVMLLTCNTEEGYNSYCGIPAHKLILVSSSGVSRRKFFHENYKYWLREEKELLETCWDCASMMWSLILSCLVSESNFNAFQNLKIQKFLYKSR